MKMIVSCSPILGGTKKGITVLISRFNPESWVRGVGWSSDSRISASEEPLRRWRGSKSDTRLGYSNEDTNIHAITLRRWKDES